ncbi:cation-binding protein [Sphaerisporangium melleum]|uniref:Cation-binding protein n=1 Tax=Sphaerisporangium melleum TaxID=321316 RepID=A0A917VF40_9ACTN|nr:nitroreductase/quinone reductase family protein [Sphaerisporangium melleum]GGK69418.1 cation-binding protein [Sphaerisporangium melleum]GII69013.1 cation-binding protein [Sphaerisporangium melleum]
MPENFNQQIIDEFRANHGKVGGPFQDGRLILLTTTGARTGARHTTPVAYLPDGERILIIASAGGAPSHPDWYHNLLAHPRVTVENGSFTYQADATVLRGEERDRVFARAAEANPGWADYQEKSARVLPVIALHQVGPPSAQGGPAGFLTAVHGAFRRELELIRKEVAASGSSLGAQLRINCLTLCQGLHYHHTMEDANLFPTLGERHPELAPVLARLDEQHRTIKLLLDELQALISGGTASPHQESTSGSEPTPGPASDRLQRQPQPGPDPAFVLAEVERLTVELEAHLDYEEEHILPALNPV